MDKVLPTEQQTTGIEGKINELETKLGDLAESVKDVCNLPPLQHEFKAGGHRPRGLVWAALKDKNSHFGGSNPKTERWQVLRQANVGSRNRV